MPINNINNDLTNNAQLDNQRLAEQQAAPTANNPVTQDSLSLTQSAQNLHQLQNKSLEAPVNQEKVEQLRTLIINGEYRINPEVLASKMTTSSHNIQTNDWVVVVE
ncbi:MAG TPA: flagellar biosynthesis anti-sigma factor FlgM [Glaciecola sp.]|jgi:negative regulator of flagellin synthesis FlgM|nr:flagellar biosynthesis anti-sigma factor FlgM [Glaciecola sp.]HCF80047.1 flagellar biosynthesis anti-sigma factor FlgM [Glaciecola sp.]